MRMYFFLFFLLISCWACGPKEDATKIACVGDSITYGSGIRFRSWRSYPAKLQAALGRDFQVGNFGKSGATALKKGDLSYHVQKEYTDALSFAPDIVIIKLGTNDSKEQNWVYKQDFYQDYLALIDRFKQLPTHPRIIVCKPVPVFTEDSSIDKGVVQEEMLPLIDEISKDAQVELIDLYRPFMNKADLFPDGVHPNAEGAELMAGHIYQYLQTHTEELD